jgi:hypothetical protein
MPRPPNSGRRKGVPNVKTILKMQEEERQRLALKDFRLVDVKDISFDSILARNLQSLDAVTTQLQASAKNLTMSKDEIQALASVIKLTMELKAMEAEFLEGMTEEQLKELTSEEVKS